MCEYKVLDLFCGCGGLSEGFKQAGYTILSGIDVNKKAIETYNFNFNKSIGLCFDLLELDSKELLEIYPQIKAVNVIIGGPPCQGFSSANRYKKEEDDKRNRLFYEFLKFVDVLNPEIVVIENVRGIITSNNGYAKRRIYEMFEERGYFVNHKILDASDYGVPQKRVRNFFVISKKRQFNFKFVKLTNSENVYNTLSELYQFENKSNDSGIYKIKCKPKTEYQKYLRAPSNKIYNHLIKYPSEIVQKRIAEVPQGGNWKNIPNLLFDNKRNNRHSSAYKRLTEDNFSVTIDTGNSHSNYFHPIYNRIPTVREAARIQSFPDDFIFLGSRTDQYRQVGNAVPPLLAYSLANGIKEFFNDEK